MPGSFCTVCRARIPKGSRCKRHAVKSPSNRSWHEPGASLVRARVRERDAHRCTICDAVEDLEIHHRVPARDGGATTMENCVTLCHDHHVEAEKPG
jgi:5-methylcytosine-specific restriction endonuclease McrA